MGKNYEDGHKFSLAEIFELLVKSELPVRVCHGIKNMQDKIEFVLHSGFCRTDFKELRLTESFSYVINFFH